VVRDIEFGTGKGKVFPHTKARSLLNPLRRLVQPSRGTVAALDLRGDETVLELGCGPGYFSDSLVAAVPRGNVVLCDLQPEMLEMALRRAPEASVVTADALALPFADESFDVVFLVAVLGEVGDATGCLREVKRTLRPAGRLVDIELLGDADFIDGNSLAQIASQSGLRLVHRHRKRLGWAQAAEFARAELIC
jgi:ubiquinone/menaquinone biosynthesis C-methylase UbiE